MSDFVKSDLKDLVAGERKRLVVNGFEVTAVHTTKSKVHVVIRTDDGETRGTLDRDRFDSLESMYAAVCHRVGVEKSEGLGDLFG